MRTLVKQSYKPKPIAELEKLWIQSGFGRRGGKGNRRLQKQRIMVFITYCMVQWDIRSVGQIGKKHVEQFYSSRWDLSAKTKMHYWYAFRVLWSLLGKIDQPPKPRIL